MLGKPVVVATCRPRVRASSRNACGVGRSLDTMASPPSNCRASRARLRSRRSAKNPTAVRAPTASVTATSSRRNSPARKSRSVWRQARANAEGGEKLSSVSATAMLCKREARTILQAPAAGAHGDKPMAAARHRPAPDPRRQCARNSRSHRSASARARCPSREAASINVRSITSRCAWLPPKRCATGRMVRSTLDGVGVATGRKVMDRARGVDADLAQEQPRCRVSPSSACCCAISRCSRVAHAVGADEGHHRVHVVEGVACCAPLTAVQRSASARQRSPTATPRSCRRHSIAEASIISSTSGEAPPRMRWSTSARTSSI